MYCNYLNGECITPTNCIGCDYYQKYFSLVNLPIPKLYNYQCPDCKGAFNQPFFSCGTSVYSYKCPFCGRPMEGMNQ